ncbi:MAG: DUF1566 domain-containing protein, partial [Pseudomonadota bacterium]
TLDELHLMYQHKDEIGGFTNGYYWSSTESNVTLSWFERFSDGYQYGLHKAYLYVVRCVRDKSFNHLNIQEKNTKTDSGKSALSDLPFEVAEKDEGKMTWYDAIKPRPDGWRLPTIDELHLMYQHKDEIGGFTDGYYWSSTEGTNSVSRVERFSDGAQGYTDKPDSYVVRCVRDKSFNHL